MLANRAYTDANIRMCAWAPVFRYVCGKSIGISFIEMPHFKRFHSIQPSFNVIFHRVCI